MVNLVGSQLQTNNQQIGASKSVSSYIYIYISRAHKNGRLELHVIVDGPGNEIMFDVHVSARAHKNGRLE